IQFSPTDVDPAVAAAPAEAAPAPAPPERPSPQPIGAVPPAESQQAEHGQVTAAEQEQVIWEARYSMRNFIGRLTGLALLTLGWIALAIYAWGDTHETSGLGLVTILLGGVLGILWLMLLYRIILARYGHFYRLTNRRLLVTTGLFRRRSDQMELIRVDDVFTRQSLAQRFLSVGTVVVTSKEPQHPVMYLTGVDDPKDVMDLVWRHARAERDGETVQVNRV
ncbi:MAG: PH domain-containing protein, partial [Isosphaeraceae bacterium]|nr:PH domain-containing protein [Isosphaeraceae bacterium]